jgi:threonine/homoserine/homoserine lactone efflux protein
MGQVVGDLLPLALGVAISPIPIIATILMLLAPRAGGASAGFLLGWVAGIVVVTTVFTVVASMSAVAGTSSSSTARTSYVKVVLGVLLLLLAARQWRSRPAEGASAELPRWMSAIDSITFPKATGLGFLLSAVNPKNLLLCAAAGTVIGGSAVSDADRVLAVMVFTVLAACTVAVPVIAYALARERMRKPLDDLKVWLQANNATVMAVLLLVMGVVVIGKGIGGF